MVVGGAGYGFFCLSLGLDLFIFLNVRGEELEKGKHKGSRKDREL